MSIPVRDLTPDDQSRTRPHASKPAVSSENTITPDGFIERRSDPLRHNMPRRLSADRRRKQLFSVALRLFSERGYKSTTMDHIADAAGVTKPLLYQHFSSKRALYLELVDSVAKDLLEAVNAAVSSADGPRQQVEKGFSAYFTTIVNHKAAFRLLYGREDTKDAEVGDALRKVEDAIAGAIDPLIDAGLDDEHRRLLSYAVVGMAESAGRYWINQQTNRSDRKRSDSSTLDEKAKSIQSEEDARLLAQRLSDLAWAGLRSVHSN